MNEIETRNRDGVKEHRHEDRDYWHPVTRVHSPCLLRPVDPVVDPMQTAWDMKKDDIMDVIKTMSGITEYIDLYGETQELPDDESVYGDPVSALNEFELFSFEWANALASVKGIRTTSMLCRSGIKGRPTDITISGDEIGSVTIHTDPRGHGWYEVKFEEKSLILEAKRLSECHGIGDMATVMRILRGKYEDHYYDLIRLPSGGHVPVDILMDMEEYGVWWLTLARIPLGKPRDTETFSCPFCGQKSFYSGVCDACQQEAAPSYYNDYVDDGTGKLVWDQIVAYNAKKHARKEGEHGEILRLKKSGNWKRCRYMKG